MQTVVSISMQAALYCRACAHSQVCSMQIVVLLCCHADLALCWCRVYCRTDLHHRSVFTGETLNLWLAHWCDLYGAILVLAVSCFAVGLAETLGAATVGLAFSNTIQMLVFYTWSVRFIADTLFTYASIEKLGWLATEIPVEGAAGVTSGSGSDMKAISTSSGPKDKDGAPVNWPSRGTVVFDNVWMKYNPSAPFALKGVTFSLNHFDKVSCYSHACSVSTMHACSQQQSSSTQLMRCLHACVLVVSMHACALSCHGSGF